MSISQEIQSAISAMRNDAAFGVHEFLSLGSRAAVDQALYRLVKAGRIHRMARGFYARTDGAPPSLSAVSKALSRRAEVVMLSPDRSTGVHSVVLTSGPSRSLQLGGHTVEFRRASWRKIELAKSAKGQVLLGLWGRGQKGLTTLEIKQATSDWRDADIDAFAGLVPAWLHKAIKQGKAQRKSVKLGLTGAYDWSNPQIKDAVLIDKVLASSIFEDVVRVCAFYGINRVKRVFRCSEFGPMTRASVSRMLANISKAIRRAERGANAQA